MSDDKREEWQPKGRTRIRVSELLEIWTASYHPYDPEGEEALRDQILADHNARTQLEKDRERSAIRAGVWAARAGLAQGKVDRLEERVRELEDGIDYALSYQHPIAPGVRDKLTALLSPQEPKKPNER